MGDKADDILLSFQLSKEDQKKYEIVKVEVTKYFIKHCNPIFEHAKFNRCEQEEGESVDNFMMDLSCFAKHCRYGKLHNEMVLDRIIVRILNS